MEDKSATPTQIEATNDSTTPNSELNQPKENETAPGINHLAVKSNVTLVVLIFVAVGLLLIGYYLLLKQKPDSISIMPAISQSDSTDQVQPTTNTNNWVTYADPKIGLTFKHPQNMLVNDTKQNGENIKLSVSVEKLSDIPEDLPLRMGRKDAIAERTLLENSATENRIKVGDTYGFISTKLSQFEVCSVMMVRNISFYHGDYRIIISSTAPVEKVKTQMPEYFHIDEANCGQEMVWNPAKTDLLEVLAKNQGTGIAQEWFSTFEPIINSVQLSNLDSSPSLQPKNSPSTTEGKVYTNEAYGFQVTYDAPYRLLTDKDSLYGYPNGVALLYTGGQAYDVIIEVWNSKAEYEKAYANQMTYVRVLEIKGKFVTLFNSTQSAENQKIIDSAKAI